MRYIEAKAKTAGHDGAPVRFSILANAGSRMRFADGDIVIDLKGTITTKNDRGVPVLYGHDWNNQLGHAEVVRVDDVGIHLDGVADVPSERCELWTRSAQTGFPWNASLGFEITTATDVQAGDTIDVNGRTENGPVRIATAVQIWECSVVTFGADDKTETTIQAEKMKGKIIMTEPIKQNDDVLTAEQQIEQIRAAKVAETERLDAIDAIAAKYSDRTFVKQATAEGWTAEKFELETLRNARANAPRERDDRGTMDGNNVAALAMLRATGRRIDESKFTDAERAAADDLRASDFRGIFEAATGFQPTRSQRADAREWIAAALSTHGLGSVLTNSANAILLNALNGYERRWAPLFKFSAVQDFKKNERYRIDSSFEFDEVAEGQELTHGTQDATTFEIQAKTYGKQYVLSYQAITNGEAIGAFNDIMQQIAFGAEAKLNRVCWSAVMNPGNGVDGTAFYHADHGSLLTGKAFSLDNLGTAIAQFASRRKKAGAESAGVEAKYLVVPPSLVASARQVVNSTFVNNGAAANNGTYNPMANIVDVISAPQLEFTDYTNNSATTWYLFAEPTACAAFEIAFVHGQQNPVVRMNDLEVGRLGVAIDGHVDFGVAVEDWRGALKCTA